MAAAISLFVFTIRQTLGERRALLAVLLLSCPALFALVARWAGDSLHGDHLWKLHQGLLIYLLLSGALPMTAMLFGSALISAEAEGGTLVYLFTRRLRRCHVLLIRFLAQTLVLAVLGALATLAAHAALLAGVDDQVLAAQWGATSPWGELRTYLAVIPWAAAAFLAVFTTFSLLTTRALVVSGMYLVIVEMIIANVPVAVRACSLSHQLRRSLAGAAPHLRRVFGLESELADRLYPPGGSGALTLLVIIAILLAVCSLLVSLRELSVRGTTRE